MYVIVTDVLDERHYLAWQPNTYDDGYFWTTMKWFMECLPHNTAEHRFAFKSHYEAIDTMMRLDIPKSCKAHVIELRGDSA